MNPRKKPYTWVTWITGFLAGTELCRYKPWVKSHYFINKGVPTETPDQRKEGAARLAEWMKAHDAMTAARVAKLRVSGATDIRVEDDNSFNLEGQFAILAGKSDIVVLDHAARTATVIDEKSGKEKPEHWWQVMVYITAFSILGFRADLKKKDAAILTDFRIDGEVEYKDNKIAVPAAELTSVNKQKIFDVMKWVGSPSMPPTTPSASECRFCDVLDCNDRYKQPVQQGAAQKYF